MKNLHKHYFEMSKKYDELASHGAESFISYYRRYYTNRYMTLIALDIEVVL